MIRDLQNLPRKERDKIIRPYLAKRLELLQSPSPTDKRKIYRAAFKLGRERPIIFSSPRALVRHFNQAWPRGEVHYPLSESELKAFDKEFLLLYSETALNSAMAQVRPSLEEIKMVTLFDAAANSEMDPSEFVTTQALSWYGDIDFLLRLEIYLNEMPEVGVDRKAEAEYWLDLANECFLAATVNDELVLIAKPVRLLLDEQNRLHSDQGPALEWKDGYKIWAIHGVIVPKDVIDAPHKMTPEDASSEPNTEIRRVMIERMGFQKFITQGYARQVQQDKRGKLWRMRSGREIITMVELINSTQEIDGTHKHYFLRVPPRTKTATEAVAWSFNVSSKQYVPDLET